MEKVMNLKSILTLVAIASVMQIGLVFANHHEGGHEGDQKCTRKGAMFKEADTNNDGKLSHDEFKANHDKRGEEMFKRMDANNDGTVDEAEKKAMHEKMHGMHKEHCERKGDHK